MINTDRVYNIKKINENGKKFIVGGAMVTSLMLSFVHASGFSDLNDKGHILYGKYWSEFSRQMEKMDGSFDINFSNLYKSGKYDIDGIEYDVKELYLVTLDDGSRCVVKAGENYDILNRKSFDNVKEDFVCLRDTKIFYDLFKDGYVYQNKVKVSSDILLSYVNLWNGEMQYETAELASMREAEKYIRRQI